MDDFARPISVIHEFSMWHGSAPWNGPDAVPRHHARGRVDGQAEGPDGGTGRLPEHTRYRDDPGHGHDPCFISITCLDCPLEKCRYDLGPKVAGALMREASVRRLADTGLTAQEIATRMDLSLRTVFRLRLQAVRAGRPFLITTARLGRPPSIGAAAQTIAPDAHQPRVMPEPRSVEDRAGGVCIGAS